MKLKAHKIILFLSILSLVLMSSDKKDPIRDPLMKPNIIFILVDDMAWADATYNGHEFFETPNIDKLVSDGVNLNQMYTGGPNCMPTRACLITGMYPPRTDVYTPGGKSKGNKKYMRLAVPGVNELGDKQFKSEKKGITKTGITSVADVLNAQGYATARMGKWHLGDNMFGFDESNSMGSYSNPNSAEILTKEAVRFITDNKDKPFFLYLPHWDVHGPLAATDDLIKKYEEKNKKMGTNYDPEYAGMVEVVDKSVKKIRETIEELGIAENTIIVFSSDNGGAHYTSNKPLKAAKGSLYEGGIRVPSAVYWQGVTKKGAVSNIPITSVDILPTFAELAGGILPTNQAVDGESFVSVIRGTDDSHLKERAIFWHYPLYLSGHKPEENVHPVYGTDNYYFRAVPASAIRKGEWKLIYYYETKTYELFNIINDPYEQNDLAKSNTQKGEELNKELQQWLIDTNAPQPSILNSDFDANAPDKKKNKDKDKKKKKKKKKKRKKKNKE